MGDWRGLKVSPRFSSAVCPGRNFLSRVRIVGFCACGAAAQVQIPDAALEAGYQGGVTPFAVAICDLVERVDTVATAEARAETERAEESRQTAIALARAESAKARAKAEAEAAKAEAAADHEASKRARNQFLRAMGTRITEAERERTLKKAGGKKKKAGAGAKARRAERREVLKGP